jgi:hypothetical protein
MLEMFIFSQIDDIEIKNATTVVLKYGIHLTPVCCDALSSSVD